MSATDSKQPPAKSQRQLATVLFELFMASFGLGPVSAAGQKLRLHSHSPDFAAFGYV